MKSPQKQVRDGIETIPEIGREAVLMRHVQGSTLLPAAVDPHPSTAAALYVFWPEYGWEARHNEEIWGTSSNPVTASVIRKKTSERKNHSK
jgi:hypothetical protein